MSSKPDELPANLAAARDEIRRLRDENTRLKAILSSFSVKSAAAIVPSRSRESLASEATTSVRFDSTCNTHAIADERVRLFRSLFRGREDVYAVRWESKKEKSGYSPACAHEWDPMICKKPGGKCTNCSYHSLTDGVVRAHLLGRRQ